MTQPSRALALAVVLLPPATIVPRLRACNATLDGPPVGFRFDDSHRPHLTLVQLFVHRDQLRAVTIDIDDVIRRRPAVTLQSTTVTTGTTAVTLGIEASIELVTLHRLLAHRLGPHALHGLHPREREAAFVDDGEPPRPGDIAWVEHFLTHSAHANFTPHVTLGIGSQVIPVSSTRFVSDEVAVCQLGRYCTCRRTLATWNLTVPALKGALS